MDAILGLDPAVLDRARISRDPRFDGKFFIAVKTAGIYCRPVCPAPAPKSKNVLYFMTAAAAAEAGFRPCLRCRPEAAPGTPAWLGTSAAVRRALRLIQEGALDEISVDQLAERIGVGARHLHRLFIQHVGASPIALAQTRRLHFAKRLLDETNLPVTQVALASGFGSLRRFNFTFQKTYGRSPRELRQRRRGNAVRGDDVVLKLAFRPPYDWAHIRDFLAMRSIPGVERIDERGYARTIVADNGHATVCVRPLDRENALELRVRGAAPTALFQISAAARRAFDLAADPSRIAVTFKPDELLGPLLKARPGMRIPGAWDPFECAVRAVLGQQISVAAARTLASRLVQRCGQPITDPAEDLTHLFPSPAALAAAELSGLGVTGARIAAIQGLARAVVDGRVDFGASMDELVAALASLRGFGSWTAHYIALRALGEPDAFPTGDLVLCRMASANGHPLTTRELQIRAEAWRPWRGYAVMHLWRAAGDAARVKESSTPPKRRTQRIPGARRGRSSKTGSGSDQERFTPTTLPPEKRTPPKSAAFACSLSSSTAHSAAATRDTGLAHVGDACAAGRERAAAPCGAAMSNRARRTGSRCCRIGRPPVLHAQRTVV
jgi:AraC family transcriptional regulator of adaptative response / DNA-3-methyladenine glycosylase II